MSLRSMKIEAFLKLAAAAAMGCALFCWTSPAHATTYVWDGSVAQGDWSDPNSWTAKSGYPSTTSDTAQFSSTAPCRVNIDVKCTVGSLHLGTAGLDVTFTSANTNDYGIVFNGMTCPGANTKWTIDGAAIRRIHDIVWENGVTVTVKNGGNFYMNHCYLGANGKKNVSINVESGSYMRVRNLYVGNGNTFKVDDATLWVDGCEEIGYSAQGGRLLIAGSHPRIIHATASAFRSSLANAGSHIDFLVPVGGYDAAPIYYAPARNVNQVHMGCDWNNTLGLSSIAINVLEESPAARVDATVTTPLIDWRNGIETQRIVEGTIPNEAPGNVFAWVQEEASLPTNMLATIVGSTHTDRLTISAYPEALGGSAVSPACGDVTLASGQAQVCTAPASRIQISDVKRATCTGWKLYSVDPATHERTLVDSGTETSYTYTHDGSWHQLEWQWAIEYAVTSAPEVTVSPAWTLRGEVATLTAAAPDGKVVYRWTDSAGAVYAGNPVRVAVTDVLNVQPEYGNAHFVATDGNDSTGDGSSANPYATIAKALTVAQAKDSVIVKPGTYRVTAESTIASAVTVRGSTGKPEDVVIAASGAIRHFVLRHAEATIEGVTFANGKPGGHGGAVDIESQGGIVRNCVATNCVANGWGAGGGAFYLNNCANGLVENCVVSNCWNNENGNGPQNTGCGGIAAYIYKQGTIRNSLFFHNGRTDGVSNNGCTVWVREGGLVENCTVVANYFYYGSGIWASGGTVRNCLIYGNTSKDDQYGIETVWYGTASCFTNCIAPLYINDYCIVTNRFLRDFANGDFTPAGAAVDAGAPAGWQAAATDVACRARVSGGRVDIGCFEADQSVADLDVDASVVHGVAPLKVVFTPHVLGLTGERTIRWDFDGNGAWDVESTGPVTNTYATGRWNMTAMVKGTEVALSAPIEILSVPKTLYVDPDCVTPEFPYGDANHAATTVAEAYDLAADGCEIVLAAKTHTVADTVRLQKGVTLRGATGVAADATLKLPASTAKRVIEVQHPQALVASVAVKGGAMAGDGGGAYVNLAGGTFSNCVFHGNTTGKWGARGGALCMSGASGLVTHCIFSNNYCNASGNGTGYDAGGGMAVYMTGGILRNSLFVRNSSGAANQPNRGGTVYLTGGTLESCSFAKNTHTYGAGVRAEGTSCVVRNCLIGGNTCAASSYEGHGEVWSGTASCFTDCLTDGATPINEACSVSATPFANIAAEDFAPCMAAVDKAAVRPWMTGATDLAGIARVQGEGPDIGCYEMDQSRFNVSVEADVTGGLMPLEVTFTVTGFGIGAGGMLCEWDWNGDGAYDDTSDGTTNHVFETGAYSVKYRITDISSGNTVVSASPIALTVVPKTLYVNVASTDPQEPYGDPNHAAKTVAAALEKALPGCEIVVAPGTYAFTSEILLDKDITVRGSTGNPEDVVFAGNPTKNFIRLVRINSAGAAVYGVTMQGGNICNNTANYTKNGGGFYIGECGGTVSNCIVRSCRTWTWGNEGDGFYIEEGANTALVTHTVVSNCVSDSSSGNDSGNGATIKAGTVRNCLFANNKVTRNAANLTHDYGTVKITGGTLENCTIVNNRSFNCSGVWASGSARVVNCAIGLNTSDIVGANTNATVWAGTAACFDKCIAPIGINGNCVVENDSMTYAAPAQGDFSLSGASAAVEGGTALGWMVGATDLAGNARIRGNAPDIGAYEADSATLSASVVADVQEGILPLTVKFTITAVNIEPTDIRCSFAFDGGAYDDASVDGAELTHTFTATGDYQVKVRVDDLSDATRFFEIPGHILVKARPELLYVDPANANPVGPFVTWETAATNVQQALDAAITGNAIVLKAGDQPVFSQVIVEKGVWIRGETGNPNETILRNANTSKDDSVKRVILLNHAGAKLSSMTVKDGTIDRNGTERLSHGGGVFIDIMGGMVSNCVIRDCYTWYHANQGGGMYIMPESPAIVTHCVFSNCQARTDGVNTRGLALSMAGGTVRNCLFVDQRNRVAGTWDEKSNLATAVANVTGGTLENCTFASNVVKECAGVWATGTATVRNCLIAGNETLSATASQRAWGGTAACFENCLTDCDPINGTCISALAEVVFRNINKRDYRLPSSSPAVDAGTYSEWMDGATDFLGRPRKVGKAPDIGYCESLSAGASIMFMR